VVGDPQGTSVQASPFLSALQLADAFFPTGLYTLSHALEAFVQEGLLKDPKEVEELLKDYLDHLVGPSESVAVAWAWEAASKGDLDLLVEVDRRLLAMKLVRESGRASVRSGRQLLSVTATFLPDPFLLRYHEAIVKEKSPGNFATALGVVARTLELEKEQAMLIELYSFVTSFLGAAMRLIRLPHDEAQTILHRLKPLMVQVVEQNRGKALGEMRAFAPFIDLMGMRHQRSGIRLFIS